MDDQQKPKFGMAELRKTYPRAGMKWDKEEDQRLQRLYIDHRESASGDFEVFVRGLSRQFGRAAGGLKARLAMHFDDVPGWDYGRDQFRAEELNKRTEEALPSLHDELLKTEYQRYVKNKDQTYHAFLKQLSARLGGVKGELIRNRLEQLAGMVQKYGREDIGFSTPASRLAGRKGSEIPRLDISGNSLAQEALRLMNETSQNLFLTGEAGTGKSTLLNYFRKTAKKNVVVLAPTGVAALNVEGQTIHSFCAFGPDITPRKVKKLSPWSAKKKLLEKLNTIVIDEISMVRADLLDCVDKFLRLNGLTNQQPFGGYQMVFIGDLYQLPPVDKDFGAGDGLIKEYNSPYFFEARAFKSSVFEFIELKTIYRQKDRVFKDLLNAVRNNAATSEHLTLLNRRALDEGEKFTFEEFAIYLTPHNARARQINNFFLERVQSPVKVYMGTVKGSFEGRELPTDLELNVKSGAQVMMLNNDSRRRWVNGTMGKIVRVEKSVAENDSNNRDNNYYSKDDNFIIGDEAVADRFIVPKDDSDTSSSPDVIVIELETG